MAVDGTFRDEQLDADLLVAHAVGDQPCDIRLSFGERSDDLLVACMLETKLHDADSTAQRRLQEAVVLLAADEVQTGRLQAACALEPVALRAFWCKLHAASLARHDVLAARTPQRRRQFGPNPPR